MDIAPLRRTPGVVSHLPQPTPDQTRWFTEEVHPHEPALRAYLQGTFPAINDVDDVVQDSYLKIWRAQPAGKIACAKAYLFRVARNTAIKVFRKRRFVSPVPVSELPEWRVLDGNANVSAVANTHQQDAIIAEAIATLPDRCRDIFKRRVLGGASVSDIAVELGLSESTVRVQLARGMAKCADYLRTNGVGVDA
jgi:RNA polymerase sigma factor (sigma-70 family)